MFGEVESNDFARKILQSRILGCPSCWEERRVTGLVDLVGELGLQTHNYKTAAYSTY